MHALTSDTAVYCRYLSIRRKGGEGRKERKETERDRRRDDVKVTDQGRDRKKETKISYLRNKGSKERMNEKEVKEERKREKEEDNWMNKEEKGLEGK
jgi:hypothetical protein